MNTEFFEEIAAGQQRYPGGYMGIEYIALGDLLERAEIRRRNADLQQQRRNERPPVPVIHESQRPTETTRRRTKCKRYDDHCR